VFDTSRRTFAEMGFVAEAIASSPSPRAGIDLRGTIPGRRVIELVRVLADEKCCERPAETVRREIAEELSLKPDGLRALVEAKLRLVRQGIEGPVKMEGGGFSVRIIDVLECTDGAFAQTLILANSGNPELLSMVSSVEILRGIRDDGSSVVSSPSIFLLRRERSKRPDVPLSQGPVSK
jgi:hypothetical protein